MNRLTPTVKLPPDGTFRAYSDEESRELQRMGDVSEKELYRRLQAYEDTGFSPEEITALVADNKRLRELVSVIESVIRKGGEQNG